MTNSNPIKNDEQCGVINTASDYLMHGAVFPDSRFINVQKTNGTTKNKDVPIWL